jgi:hypothetical protein
MNSREPLSVEAIARLTVPTEPYLSCDECFDRADGYVEALVHGDPPDDPAMRTHLAACPACAEEVQSLLELAREDLTDDGDWPGSPVAPA